MQQRSAELVHQINCSSSAQSSDARGTVLCCSFARQGSRSLHGEVGPRDPATLASDRLSQASDGPHPRAPLLVDDIVTIVGSARQAVAGWATEVHERRDSALLLLGFAGAFRRSELVELVCGDVAVHRLDGIHVRLRRSKTDQEGIGAVRSVPFTTHHVSCPRCAYVRWAQVVAAYDLAGRPGVIRLLRTTPAFEGHVCRGGWPRMRSRAPLFRAIRKNGNLSETPLSGASVHAAIRRRAALAGYDDTLVAQLGGLRCGPGSSPRRSATASTRTPSCARPDIRTRRRWSCTPVNTPHSSVMPSQASVCSGDDPRPRHKHCGSGAR
jgi:hypothetical protein